MEWKELPYAAGDITVKVCYAAKEDAKIRFDFGEGTKRRQGPVVELPATGGEWVTVDAFTMKSDVNGWRRTVLRCVYETGTYLQWKNCRCGCSGFLYQ